MGALILLFRLTSCSHSSQKVGNGDINPNMSSTEKEVAQQAVSYVKALQSKKYQKAYDMVSHIYNDADARLEITHYRLTEVMERLLMHRLIRLY
jgi:hypothetical protein